MAATVLHFGIDECNRVLVLRHAGYLVDDCPSINQFRTSLNRGIQPEALLFSKSSQVERQKVVTLARSSFLRAPLIRFEDMNDRKDDQNFDLVIDPLITAPAMWLQEIAATIERTHALRANFVEITKRSEWLVQQLSALRQKSIVELERSARQRQAAEKMILQFRKPPNF
jgi:hypothetical protein